MFLTSRRRSLVAVEITTNSVKVLELSGGGRGGFSVEAYACEPLPDGVVADREISDLDAAAKVIEKAVDSSGTRSRFAVTSVNDAAAITRVLPMPADLPSHELEEQVFSDAEQHIPFPVEEVMLDYSVLGPSPSNPEELIDVLIVASRNTVVEGRQAALQLAGLETKVVDIDSFAVEHVVNHMKERNIIDSAVEIVAVCDIGQRYTQFSVIHNDRMVYSREQQFGGHTILDEMQRFYGMSALEAIEAQQQGALPEDYQSSVLDPFVHQTVEQVNRFKDMFFSSSGMSNIDLLLLAGGCASISGIDGDVEAGTGITTSIANPFSDVDIPKKFMRKDIQANMTGMIVPFGLALRGFD